MTMFTVTVRCESGHEQNFYLDSAGFTFESALYWAGLLDGTAYAFPPGPDSVIGKCGICGTRIKASVHEETKT